MVRKRVALPLVGSDIFQVIRASQNSSQLLDVNLSELYSFITNQFASGFVPTSRTITINGVTYDLTQNRSWTVAGAAAWGSISGVITNQLDLIAYLLANYQPIGNYVPTSRTITINGVTYDLSANRSWTISTGGTVTSVGTGTGLAGGPITGAGTISLNSKLAPADSLTGNALKFLRVNAGETAVEYASVSSSGGILHGTASGTDTYTVTIAGATAYADGDAYLIRFTNGNTTSATLNINAQGAVPLYRNNDGALIGGDIIAGGEMLCVYNSTTNRFQVIGTAPNTLLSYVTNDDSVTLTKGMVVYAFGGTGDRMTVKRASNLGDATSAQTVGLVLSTSIAANQKGLIMMQGLLDGLGIVKPVNGWLDGDPVYLGDTPGTITRIKPYAPKHLVYLGVVTTASPGSAGRMYVKVQNGYELDELHNVQAQSPSLNDTLYYDNTVSPAQWKTASVNSLVSSNLKTGSFGVTVDGVTGVVQVGNIGYVVMPYAGTITGWSITSNVAGTVSFDITKASGAIPTISIITSGYPTISGINFATSTSVGGWSTSFAAGDVFGFSVRSSPAPSLIKNATLTIKTTRS